MKDDAIPTLNLPAGPSKTYNDNIILKANDFVGKRNLEEGQSSDVSMMDAAELQPMRDASSQTCEPTVLSSKNEVVYLREKVAALETANKELMKTIKELNKNYNNRIKTILAQIFTEGQIRKLMKPELKSIHWLPEDISSAISLRSVSPKAYRYLRANGYPLPSLSTLRDRAASFNLQPGMLYDVLTLLKAKASNMDENDRLCVLSFDEMYVSNRVDIDKKDEQKIGPHKSCQTIMARGLLKNWKQPVYYKFDQQMTVEIINQIISKLYDVGFIVTAIVCNMGPGNRKLISLYNISDKNCHFSHPANSTLKVYVFADAPHLIKLVRNHILDNGLNIEGHCINRLF